MNGHYEPYPVSVQLLQKHKFCTLDQFLNFIDTFEVYNINDKPWHKYLKEYFAYKLRTQCPFGRYTRFADDFYVHLDSAKIRTTTNQFRRSLAQLDLFEEIGTNDTSANRIEYINNMADAQESYAAAFAKWADIIKSTNAKELKENGVYSRETFEEKYVLTWIADCK